MCDSPPFLVSGYVLAGGQSSRMGRDKALLELAGKPLVGHAVAKLRKLCTEVAILSASPDLAPFASLVADRSPGCGPLGGIDAALAHTTRDWCLILPVDVPFLPSTLLERWIRTTLAHAQSEGTRLAIFVVDGRPQPALLLIHRDLASSVAAAIARDERKLLPVLSDAAAELASRCNLPAQAVFRKWVWNVDSLFSAQPGSTADEPSTFTLLPPHTAAHLFFANLNTPEDFAEAVRHVAVLDA